MSGYPDRASRRDFGPSYLDTRPVIRPAQQISGRTTINLLMWQMAGMNLVVPRASVEFTTLAGAVDTQDTFRSWDPNDLRVEATITNPFTGRYVVALPELFVENQAGVSRRVGLRWPRAFITTSATDLEAFAQILTSNSAEIFIENLVPSHTQPPDGSRIRVEFY